MVPPTKSNCFSASMAAIFSFTSVLLFHLLPLSLAQEVDIRGVVPSNYNSKMRPGNPLESNTLNVSISIFINDLTNAVNMEQTISLDLILVKQWVDSRVNATAIGRNQNFIITEPSVIQQFWLPEIYFINGVSVSVVNSFQTVEKLTITGDGLLSYAQRFNAKLMCPMNLQNFPHDYQYCPIKISNLIYNSSEIRLNWNQFNAYPGDYPIFKIRYWWTGACDDRMTMNQTPGNDCIQATVKLVRRLGYYIIRYYLLSFLSVAISIVNFWVPINAWPARITLLVMPLLNLIQQDISIQNDVGVYYVTSFHWWMMWLHGIIYLEIVEYAVAIAWAHFISDKKYFAKLLEQANAAAAEGNTPPLVPPYVQGYYFGNKGLYAAFGHFFDRVLYFCFGNVDYHLDPYTRNKVDYMARLVFGFGYVFYVFLYVMITTIYWSANFY